jgi:hypothetical protein
MGALTLSTCEVACIHCVIRSLIDFFEFGAPTLLRALFNREVEIPRIKHSKRQTLDTLISEETLLLAKYLRNEEMNGPPNACIAFNPTIFAIWNFRRM